MAYNYYGQPNFGAMNYGGYNAAQMNYGQPPAPPVQPQMQTQGLPKTNKIFVTSLDDALNRPADYNSVVIYLHQDLPLLFEITTDPFGKKTHKTFTITPSNEQGTTNNSNTISPELSKRFATKEEVKALSDKIDALTIPKAPKKAPVKPEDNEID